MHHPQQQGVVKYDSLGHHRLAPATRASAVAHSAVYQYMYHAWFTRYRRSVCFLPTDYQGAVFYGFLLTTVASGAEERGGSSAAWQCSYFSSFQPFRSYLHDHRDAKICDARSQILCSTTNFSDNRGIVR